MMKSSLWLSILAVLLCSQVVAQTLSPIVDLNSATQSGEQASTPKSVHSAQKLQQSEQYYQMQILKDEVRTLRGMLEEINYQLQQIKQRQMDDYLNIDRRLMSLTASQVAPDSAHGDVGSNAALGSIGDNREQSTVGDRAASEASVNQAPKLAVQVADIKADYDSASNLLLKNRDLEGAVLAFQKHINIFPESPYVANAYYWLGEIYLLQGQQEQSVQSFRMVVDYYADHNKAEDAKFKLGKLYHKLGKTKQAKSLLREAAESNGGAGAKARAYLQANDLQ